VISDRTKTLTIREAKDCDLGRIVELQNLWQPEPLTEEIKRDQDRRFPPGGILRRMVAEIEGEGIVGYSGSSRVPFEEPGLWRISVTVDTPWRCKGIGSALASEAIEFARSNGATKISDYVLEKGQAGIRFAERLGGKRSEHLFESSLDPRSFDPSPYEERIEKLRREGIRFITFADTAMDEAAKRKFYELHVATDSDMPHSTPDHMYTYEQLMQWLLEAYWWDPSGYFIAVDGDQWVGMVGVAMYKPDKAYNEHAGVIRSHRGRGIATALKVFGMEFAKARGAVQLRTNNHMGNKPMLAINERFGYIPEPGWYRYDIYLKGKE
jgi:mycothiol synthase